MIKLEEGKYYRTADGHKVGPLHTVEGNAALWDNPDPYYRTVTTDPRATPNRRIVAEWDDEPKLWQDMTPEEKGVLLLAEHEGKVIECWNVEEWCAIDVPYWFDDCAYRVRPEPERETVFMGICQERDKHWIASSYSYPSVGHTHRITFDLVDGEPDCASIKMERIDD